MPAAVLLYLLLLAHHHHTPHLNLNVCCACGVFQTRSALFEHRKSRDREFARRRTDYHLWGGDYTYPLNPAEARATRKNLRRSKAGDRELETSFVGAGRCFLRMAIRAAFPGKRFPQAWKRFLVWLLTCGTERCLYVRGQGAGGWTA